MSMLLKIIWVLVCIALPLISALMRFTFASSVVVVEVPITSMATRIGGISPRP